MDDKDRVIAALGVGLIIAVVAIAVITYSIRISGSGSIKTVGIGVFSNEDCTVVVSAIHWGTISPGGFSRASFYIKNTGNTPVNVSFTIENVVPANFMDYASFSWNMTDNYFSVDEKQFITMTLTISTDIIGITDFSHDIVVKGEG